MTWEELIENSFGEEKKSSTPNFSWTERVENGPITNKTFEEKQDTQASTSSNWVEQIRPENSNKTSTEELHRQSQSSPNWAEKVASPNRKVPAKGLEFPF